MDKEKAKRLTKIAYNTVAIIRMIRNGHRSSTVIAKKVGCTKQVAQYYIKLLTHD